VRAYHSLQLGRIGVGHTSPAARNPAVVHEDVDEPELTDDLTNHSFVVLL
jgi:hypothetical protein